MGSRKFPIPKDWWKKRDPAVSAFLNLLKKSAKDIPDDVYVREMVRRYNDFPLFLLWKRRCHWYFPNVLGYGCSTEGIEFLPFRLPFVLFRYDDPIPGWFGYLPSFWSVFRRSTWRKAMGDLPCAYKRPYAFDLVSSWMHSFKEFIRTGNFHHPVFLMARRARDGMSRLYKEHNAIAERMIKEYSEKWRADSVESLKRFGIVPEFSKDEIDAFKLRLDEHNRKMNSSAEYRRKIKTEGVRSGTWDVGREKFFVERYGEHWDKDDSELAALPAADFPELSDTMDLGINPFADEGSS